MDSRKYYVKEYDEALSRLEAAERTPGPFIPRPLGPTPYYKTPENWNRIMRETRHGVLPKYTITQRFRCTWDDKISKGDHDMIYYRFKLDPNFAFCQGARKSLAVRGIGAIDSPMFENLLKSQIQFTIEFNNFEIYIQDQTVAGLENMYHKMELPTEHLEIEPNPNYNRYKPINPDTNPLVNVLSDMVEQKNDELNDDIFEAKWDANNDLNLTNVCIMIQIWLQYHYFGDNELTKPEEDVDVDDDHYVEYEAAKVKARDYFSVEVTCEDRNIHIRFRVKPGKCVIFKGGFTIINNPEHLCWFFGVTDPIWSVATTSKKIVQYKKVEKKVHETARQ